MREKEWTSAACCCRILRHCPQHSIDLGLNFLQCSEHRALERCQLHCDVIGTWSCPWVESVEQFCRCKVIETPEPPFRICILQPGQELVDPLKPALVHEDRPIADTSLGRTLQFRMLRPNKGRVASAAGDLSFSTPHALTDARPSPARRGFFFVRDAHRREEDHNSNGQAIAASGPTRARLTGVQTPSARGPGVAQSVRAGGTRSAEATRLRRLVKFGKTFMGAVTSEETGPMIVHVRPC